MHFEPLLFSDMNQWEYIYIYIYIICTYGWVAVRQRVLFVCSGRICSAAKHLFICQNKGKL